MILTLDDLAKQFKVNRRTIRRMIEKKQIPYFRVGNRYRFSQDSINKWIDKQQKEV